MAFVWERVGTLADLRAALDRACWDAILCEHHMAGMAYTAALAEVQQRGLGIPFLVIAPTADEDQVARAVRLGVRDFISIGRLARLPQVLMRELAPEGQRPQPGPPSPEPDPSGLLLNLMDEAYGLLELIEHDPLPADFRFVAVNPAFERLTRLAGSAVLGRTLQEAAPGMDPAWITRFAKVARTGEPAGTDSYRSLFGRTFSGVAFCPKPGFVALLFNDVTEGQAAEVSRERLATAVEHAGEGILLADLDGTIAYANPALERILGHLPHALQGRPLAEAAPGLELADAPWQGRLPRPDGQGGTQLLDCTLTPVRDPLGSPKSFVGVVRDVTLEAETERSLRRMEKMNALAEVAGGVSHDFNNLLTAILSASELIEWQLADDSPIRHKLQVIYQAVTRARELNRQIRSFSRQSEEKSAPFDLSAVAREAAQLIRATFPASIQVRTALAQGVWAKGDADQVHQVIMNLAINALQAMLPGGGLLELTLEAADGAATLKVRDTGCGMEPALLERIFEPFFTSGERGAGKGLGLSVVHDIVHRHQGAISVKSEPGQGTVFQVVMPCTVRADEPAAAEAQAETAGKERILFVDDEEVLSALGKQGLQMLGYRVTARSDAQEALEEVRLHPQEYDLVITDLSMPGLTGVELAQRIRKIRKDLPAILVTGAFQDPMPLEGLAVPFADVLLKPVTTLDMARSIRKVMNRRPAPVAEAEAREEGPSVILLAEDSQTTRSLLRSWLVKAGYQVQEARDGQEAWEAFDQHRHRYRLLITDIVMPRLDGLKLTARIRAIDPSMPILMLSSSEDTGLVKEALHLHVSEFLSKPFESRMLTETVQRLCADQASRVKALRSHETAQAVRMAQRAMEALPEPGMPIYSISEPLTDAGGDVFRAFRREDGSIFFALADVAGHSVISSYAVAAYLGMLSNFIAGQLDLRQLAHHLNRGIAAGPFSEVPICGLFGHWQPSTGRIHLLNSGIPHALWYRAAAGATGPVAINGTPLGILDDLFVEEKVVYLAPGDRLLLGSDGFFEAVSAGRTAFLELAGPTWTALGSTDIVQAITVISEASRTHAGGQFEDDLLVVALEQPAPAEDPDSFTLSFPPDPQEIDGACERLAGFLDDRPWSAASFAGQRFDALLAVREALSNAMIHGDPCREGAVIQLRAGRTGDGAFQVTVLDQGQGFDLKAHQPPDTQSSERGRGIPLIRHFTRGVAMVGGELTMIFS